MNGVVIFGALWIGDWLSYSSCADQGVTPLPMRTWPASVMPCWMLPLDRYSVL